MLFTCGLNATIDSYRIDQTRVLDTLRHYTVVIAFLRDCFDRRLAVVIGITKAAGCPACDYRTSLRKALRVGALCSQTKVMIIEQK